MIKISKKEAEAMRKMGYKDCVKHTYGHHKHYFLVEEKDNIYEYDKRGKRVGIIRLGALNALEKYREERIVK